MPRRIVYRLPDSLSFEQAALIEAASVAVHAVNLTPVRLGDTGVVVGSGMIGVLTVQALRAAGCANVIVIDPVESRLQMAMDSGATDVRTSGRRRLQCRRRDRMRGRERVRADRHRLRPQRRRRHPGRQCFAEGRVPLQAVVSRQIRLQGSCASNGEYPAVIELMARGVIRVESLISAVAPLKEGADWFGKLYRREGNLMKVILQP